MSLKKFTLGGIDYPLSHLSGLRVAVAAKDPMARPATLQVTFSSHVYCEKWNPAVHAPEQYFVIDGEERAFCPGRYGCSVGLADLIRYHVGGKAHEGRDGHGNWNYFFHSIADGIRYPIYFRLGKADRIIGADGILHIISAYQRPTLMASNRYQAVKFARLVHLKCQLGKK